MTNTTWKDRMEKTETITPAAEILAPAPVVMTPPPSAVPAFEANSQFGQLIQLVDRLVANPELDLERVERFLSMARDLRREQAVTNYTAAFAAMQSEIPIIDENGAIKNKTGVVQSTYAYWEDINEAVKPVLSRHGFALDFPKIDVTLAAEAKGVGMVEVTAEVSHVGGHSKSLTLKLPFDDEFGKNTIQRYASATTYAKRYAAIAILNIVSRATKAADDDGNATPGEHELTTEAVRVIEMATTCMDLLKWRDEKAAAHGKAASAAEIKRVQALWNTKFKRLREQEGA